MTPFFSWVAQPSWESMDECIAVCHDAAISMALPPRIYRKEFAWFGRKTVLLINTVPQMLHCYINDTYATVMFLDKSVCLCSFPPLFFYSRCQNLRAALVQSQEAHFQGKRWDGKTMILNGSL